MAFKMNGFSGFGNKIKTARAKRLIKKYVEDIVHPDFGGTQNITEEKFDKAEKKMIKADRLLQEAGYDDTQRELATGVDGVETALSWTGKNTITHSQTGENSTYQIKKNKTIIKGPKGKVVYTGNDKKEVDKLLNR